MSVINSPFESKYGFKGPGFSVDENGNIVATSITTSSGVTETDIVDFNVGEDSGVFLFTEVPGNTPTLTLSRTATYKFKLAVPTQKFYIYQSDQSTLYSTGLAHSDGSNGEDAQGKETGVLAFSISINAPNTLYYGNEVGNVFGTINVIDPAGRFSTVEINSTEDATSTTTGALTVAGGLGVEGDVWIGGTFNVGGVGISSIYSGSNLTLDAANNIVLKIDGNTIGVVNEDGITAPVVDTTINNTIIGNVTPTSATFTSAIINEAPVATNNATNKQYVDTTAAALAITFGL